MFERNYRNVKGQYFWVFIYIFFCLYNVMTLTDQKVIYFHIISHYIHRGILIIHNHIPDLAIFCSLLKYVKKKYNM